MIEQICLRYSVILCVSAVIALIFFAIKHERNIKTIKNIMVCDFILFILTMIYVILLLSIKRFSIIAVLVCILCALIFAWSIRIYKKEKSKQQ